MPAPVPSPSVSPSAARDASPSTAPAAPSDGASDGGPDEALRAARAFEKLLIHDMLKAMRRGAAVLGESPSGGRALYDDMLDERLADAMSSAGGLGLASALAADLRARHAVPETTRAAAASRAIGAGSGRDALTAAEIVRLRDLVRPEKDAPGGRTAPRRTGAGAFAALAPSGTLAPDPIRVSGEAAAQRAFIAPLLPHARASAARLGTSPDAVLAIAALESGWGRHVPRTADGRSSHNLFGIKARTNEPDAGLHRTVEYRDGSRVTTLARFRTFAAPGAAVSGFADFVLANPRYAVALERADDPREFLRQLQAAGYATDPRYAEKAIALMQRIETLREELS